MDWSLRPPASQTGRLGTLVQQCSAAQKDFRAAVLLKCAAQEEESAKGDVVRWIQNIQGFLQLQNHEIQSGVSLLDEAKQSTLNARWVARTGELGDRETNDYLHWMHAGYRPQIAEL